MCHVTHLAMYSLIDVDLVERAPERGPVPRVADWEIERAHALGRIIDPVIVRALKQKTPISGQTRYEIVGNEKSWIIAQRLGWHQVPCVSFVLDDDDVRLYREAQVEGDTIDRVLQYQRRLNTEPDLTVTALAAEVGWSRTELQHNLCLTRLSSTLLQYVRTGQLSLGHARRLASPKLSTALREELARSIVEHGWPVRVLEDQLRRRTQNDAAVDATPSVQVSVETAALERSLSTLLGCAVTIRPPLLSINYCGNLEILDGLLERLGYQVDA